MVEVETGERASLGRRRPYQLIIPAGLDEDQRVPLVLLLHGYGASPARLLEVLEVRALSGSREFVAAVPAGTRSPEGRRFWNATGACCNFHDLPVDDVRYLAAVIDDAVSRAPVDSQKVAVIGFSNGGFMAHRLACELDDRVDAIASIAGSTFLDPERCQPESTVTVIQIHGDRDDIVPYLGGHTLGRPNTTPHPSAVDTVSRWGEHNGCDSATPEVARRDLEPNLAGAETQVTRFPNCRAGAVELWTVRGGTHFVALHQSAIGSIYDTLAAHWP